ncbi:MAG: hypothetical protein ABSG65_36135 [Bryobacteraceae bacterium]|jgi:hypothetical protein
MYHADHLTARAGLNSLRELPYRVELRKVRNQRQRRFIEEKGVPAAKRVNDGVPILDTGQNITLFDGHLLSGLRLEPYLWAPRIVHIPDEPQPLRKWRAEFRQGWTDSGGQLSWEQEASLRQAIREMQFRCKGGMVEPTFESALPELDQPRAVRTSCSSAWKSSTVGFSVQGLLAICSMVAAMGPSNPKLDSVGSVKFAYPMSKAVL